MRFVYFIRSGESGLIKIGSTRSDPRRRLKELQIGSAERLHFLGCLLAEETKIHRLFQKHRATGEWFLPHQDILDFIRDHTTVPAEPPPVIVREQRTRKDIQIACLVTRETYLAMLDRQKSIEASVGMRPSMSAVVRIMIEEVAGA